MVLDNVTKMGKIGLLLFVIGAAFFLVGFSVPYWISYDHVTYYVGLWEYCTAHACGGKTVDARGDQMANQDWFRGTQALACLSLIAMVAAVAVLLLFLCGKPKKFLLISIILIIAAAVLAFLAAVVFGSEVNKYINLSLTWGFAFDIIGGIFYSGAAILLIVEYVRR